ncbi:MAG: sugar diacid recognition domain-containing protein [Ferrimonas sp.]
MQLTDSIAQQIVDCAMNTIPFSINIIDEKGRIIGSGDKSRLHQIHGGALIALSDNRTVEINHLDAINIKGVKPGINLPIYYQNKPIGIIGISGQPCDVRQHAELAKVIAELVIQQSEVIAQYQWQQRHKEALLQQLLHEPHCDQATIFSQLGLPPQQQYVAAIIKLNAQQQQPVTLEQLQHIMQHMTAQQLTVAIHSMVASELVLLHPIPSGERTLQRQALAQELHEIVNYFMDEHNKNICIAIGQYTSEQQPNQLVQSYQTAQATMKIAMQVGRPASSSNALWFYHEHLLPVMVQEMLGHSVYQPQLLQPINALIEYDGRGILQQTLMTYFENESDMSATCKALDIHRNTLRYRLEKIESITELQLQKINDMTWLYLSTLAYQAQKNN